MPAGSKLAVFDEASELPKIDFAVTVQLLRCQELWVNTRRGLAGFGPHYDQAKIRLFLGERVSAREACFHAILPGSKLAFQETGQHVRR